MADAPQDAHAARPDRPFWRVPVATARALAERIVAAGDDLSGIIIRIDEQTHGAPMYFDVALKSDAEAGVAASARLAPLNDTFKCPPRCG